MENLNLLESRSFGEWLRLVELCRAIKLANDEWMREGIKMLVDGHRVDRGFKDWPSCTAGYEKPIRFFDLKHF